MHEILSNGSIGQIQIADEVLAIISGTAALEVEGVITSHSVADVSSRFAKRNFSKGIKIIVTDDKVSVDISIIIKFGYKIHEVSEEVQKRIKIALETMVGMKVKEVNVNVLGIQFDKILKAKVNPAKRR